MIWLLLILLIPLAFLIIAVIKGIDPLDFYRPKRWKSFLIWILKKRLRKMDGSEIYLEKHELIQYAYRVAKCFECIRVGKCVNCKCDAEGRMNNRTDACSAEKWGLFLSKEEFAEVLKDPLVIEEFNKVFNNLK